MICPICHVRKAKRACPGMRADICSVCCGTEREQSIDCPLECEFLRQAHQHKDTLVDAYNEHPASTDYDAREALAALVKTWRTLESGLIYDTRPANPYAAAMYDAVKDRVAEIKARLVESGERGYLRDSSVLKLLIFLRRLDALNRSYAGKPARETSLELAEPGIIV